MKILVVGSGGREHALAWKLSRSPRVSALYCAPGNAGIEQLARCIPIPATDIAALKRFVLSEGIDLTVVGPEAPLALGLVNEFRKAKLKVFGPTQGAAQIEASKAFAKELMRRHRIPTPQARTFDRLDQARAYIETHPVPLVVKADGLAQGKGVIVAASVEEAWQALSALMDQQTLGEAGQRVVIEEFLDGEELTVMAFTDGKTVVPMVPAQDHKRVGDGDTGPNTGGMGAYAPAPLAVPSLQKVVRDEILQPTVDALAQVGRPFHGVLYAGLMIVDGKPSVLEFNARFGDPETQVVLPLLETDLVDIMEVVVEHRLDQVRIDWSSQAAVCVVLTSGGYPGSYATGVPIKGLPVEGERELLVFHAGTSRKDGDLVTAGGRVLGVTGVAPNLGGARDRAYEAARVITFDGCHYRSDIATRALQRTS